MSSNERVLYPMLGVGAFFGLFWTGFVIGYELGWACNAMLVNGLLFGCLGTYFTVRLERYDSRRTDVEPPRISRRGDERASDLADPSRATSRSYRAGILR